MEKFTIYPAIVKDNNDPNKSGRIKIKIEYKMDKVSEDILPWVSPFHLGGGSENNKISFIPDIGDKVYVFFLDDTYYRNGRYIADMAFDKKGTHNESIGSMTGTYPNLKFIKLKNGVSIALNSSESEVSIVAGSSEIFIDKDGNVNITAGKDINVSDNNGNEVKMEAGGVTIKTGDATPWAPCVIKTCPIGGFPHGGAPAGITKLKGE